MAAVLRVKRKYTDTPMDMLVIACKRPRIGTLSEFSTPAVQTVVQFAGTLKDPTENVVEHISKVLPTIDKSRTDVNQISDSNDPTNSAGGTSKWIGVNSMIERYKINCQHSLDKPNEEESEDKWMTVIDVEDSWSISRTADQEREEKEDITDYVYDLYYAQTSDNVWFENDGIWIQQTEYSSLDSEHEDHHSSDSNSESNWRNDYPDTESDNSADDAYESDCDVYNDDEFLYGESGDKNRVIHMYSNMYSYKQHKGRIQIEQSNSSNDLSNDEERLPDHDSDESLGFL